MTVMAAGFVPVLLVSASVSALALGVYDQTVRQPRTPRIAVVDIARLYAAAESQARASLVARAAGAASTIEQGAATGAPPGAPGSVSAGGATAPPAAASALPPELATMREMSNFGPRLEGVLRQISTECGCVVAAMAAVVGDVASVPDYTHVAAGRLGVELPATPATAAMLPRR
ncbi:MAG: hypothetical protein KIT17_05500 [Rubrivivax sp.]|nr:hypothetical protein [Rubrivivax sp.]